MFWSNMDPDNNQGIVSKCVSNQGYTLEVYATDETCSKFGWRIVRDCTTILEAAKRTMGILTLQKKCQEAFLEYFAYSDQGKLIVRSMKAAFPVDFWTSFEEDEGELVGYRKRGYFTKAELLKLVSMEGFMSVCGEHNGGIFASFALTSAGL